jgi:hypothetical protein
MYASWLGNYFTGSYTQPHKFSSYPHTLVLPEQFQYYPCLSTWLPSELVPCGFPTKCLLYLNKCSILYSSYFLSCGTLLNIDPLKLKLDWIIFKNSVRTAKKTWHFTITKINQLTLFKEIIAVYCENHRKHINMKCRNTDCWSRWYTVTFGL